MTYSDNITNLFEKIVSLIQKKVSTPLLTHNSFDKKYRKNYSNEYC
jgi:hypothetical protein